MTLHAGGQAPQAAPLGRIVGTSVLELAFRCHRDADVCVGDLLIAEEAGASPLLFRVTNVRYGLEGEPELAARMAGRMMTMESDGQYDPAQFWDSDARLYKTGIGVPLGYVRDGKFRKAKTLPPHFARVRRADEEDYAFLREDMGDVEVGYLRSGETTVPFPVGVRGEMSFPYHIGVFATTGMGKSNLMRVLAASVLSTGRYGLLIVDPHGEYHDGAGQRGRLGLKHHPVAERNLRVYSTRAMRGAYAKLQISAHEIEVADLKQLYEFSGPQAELLDAARHRFGSSWLADVHDRSAVELKADMPHFHEGSIAVVKRRIERLFRSGLVHRDPKVSVTKAIVAELHAGKVVLVDSGGLSDKDELLVTSVLARAVFDANKDAFGTDAFDDLPPVLITLEEAQRVLGRAAGTNVFAQICREGRKFKTGLCAITQQPKLVDRECISQFNTLFIMGLADKQDRETLKDSAKQDVSALENEIQTLMPGEVLITSPYAPFAIPAKVHLFEEYVERLAKSVRVEAVAPKARPGADFY
jgi:DNA helicase HerA-like ATPase